MDAIEEYREFLKQKIKSARALGFEPGPVNPALFEFQKRIAQFMVRRGRAACFAECGLGKTLIQLEVASQVVRHTGGRFLILAPLAVAPQTVAEGARFGFDVREVVNQSECSNPGIYIANYEKLHLFDLSAFAGIGLDESSILANYTGKTKRELCEKASAIPYRFCYSATPAPNDHMELGNHSDFLGVMDSSEVLSRWFINDTMKAGSYRLKHHAAADFWRWVATWAVCISKPSDLGFSDDGYILPNLWISDHIVDVDVSEGADAGELFRNVDLSATGLHRELRKTAPARAKAVADLVNADSDYWIVWANTDYEADALKALIPDAVDVRGSMPEAKKRRHLNDFTTGKRRVIITKPRIGGMGINWQHCHKMAFVGLSYSFKDEYQAIRRSYRFGQTMPVEVHIFMAETEASMRENVVAKIHRHEEMQAQMAKAVSINHIEGDLELTSPINRRVERGDSWEMILGDSCEVMRDIPENSIGLSVHSPPFANLYIYSDSERDMGNCEDSQEFFRHYSFIAKELFRVTIPGRLAVVHCKDLPRYMNRDGAAGLVDFPGQIIRCFEDAGWTFHSRVTIWKCPVIERQRTNNFGLLYGRLVEDSCNGRQGMADFLVVFRKWDSERVGFQPVNAGTKPERFTEYVGLNPPHGHKANPYEPGTEDHRWWSIGVWQKYASPVWDDIDQTNVLNYDLARDGKDERHICPLQLDVVERCVHLWSNPGDLVFSPFSGIGSEGFPTVKMGRRFKGIELKESYFDIAVRNLIDAEYVEPDLVDLINKSQ